MKHRMLLRLWLKLCQNIWLINTVLSMCLTRQPAGESIAMQGIVEKPAVGAAPSNLSVVGRYILPAKIMQLLEQTPRGAGNEIQLTDAIAMLQQTNTVEAYHMQGQTFDCGSKLGYLKAVLHYGVEHPQLGQAFKTMIAELEQ